MESVESRESEPGITLEPATADDLEAYIEIEKSIAGQRIYSALTTEEEVRNEFAKVKVYMIKRGETVAGSASYEMKSPDHAYIDGLAIKPEFQGRGIGSFAMQKILEELSEVKLIDLVTHPENARAINLYEGLGFKLGERKENYFGDGEPRVVMTLEKS